MPKRLPNIWANLERIFLLDLSKVAQSGHTENKQKLRAAVPDVRPTYLGRAIH